MTTILSEQAEALRHPIINPANGEVIDYVDWSTPEQIDSAVETAAEAFPAWSATPVKERVQVMFRFKQVIESHLDELSELCSAENGKTVGEAKGGILKGVEVIEYAASLPQLIPGQYLEVAKGVSCRLVREPLGVAASVTPINFPVMVPLGMIPISLACGNTLVHKPSEHVPLSVIRMREFLIESGLPEGAYQVVLGARQAVETLVENPRIQAIGFVGSSRVAELVYRRPPN